MLLLLQSWIIHAVIHTAYATIKMPSHKGVITLKSD
jgi:hypothetical protein